MARPDAKAMKTLVGKGQAMPPKPGSGRTGRYQIRNAGELSDAISAVGRVRPNTEEARSTVRRFIIKRARALNLADRIPDTWNADGTLKTSS